MVHGVQKHDQAAASASGPCVLSKEPLAGSQCHAIRPRDIHRTLLFLLCQVLVDVDRRMCPPVLMRARRLRAKRLSNWTKEPATAAPSGESTGH
jgi:hypothetical protein